MYAEPLVLSGEVVVATENDSIYAFDAISGGLRWRSHLASPVPGSALPCGNIDPSGITSTPVASADGRVIYTVAFESGLHHVLYATSAANGKTLWSRDIDPPGLDPKVEQQRAALALANGRVYVAYGGLYGDCGSFHGALVAAPESGPGTPLSSYQVPAPGEAAIWAPSGPAIDPAGNLYIATGNGSSSTFDYGNAVIKLSPQLKTLGFFAPRNAGSMNESDLDLGSTGPVLMPGARAFIIGKTGIGYLLDAGHLGGLGHPLSSASICDRAFGGTAFADGTLYVPCESGLTSVKASAGTLSIGWRQSAANDPAIVAGPGVWTIGGDRLYQLDPGSGQVRFSAQIGTAAPFATPAAANGRIYVAASGRIQAFG